MDNIVKELKLQLGEREVSLTMDEAKKLKAALDELFGKEVHHDHYWHWWYPTWSVSNDQGPYRIITTGGCTAQYDSNTGTMSLKVA